MASAFSALKPPSREDRIAAAKKDGSFHGKRDAYNKSAKAHGYEMDENGTIKKAISSRGYTAKDRPKQLPEVTKRVEDDPIEDDIMNQIVATERMVKRTQHLLNEQRLRGSGRHKEASIQKHLHNQLLPDEDESKRGAQVFQSP